MPRVFLVVGIFFASVLMPVQPESAELQAKLDARVTHYSVSATGLAEALAKTSKEFQLPIGIEWVKDASALRILNRTWKDETVRQILRAIVEEYPDYDFQVEDGVVHVFRRDLLDDDHNFLNLKVPDFFLVQQERSGFANRQLESVVQNIVSPRNMPSGAGEGGSYATGMQEKPVTLNLRGSTVRQALEKLAAASKLNMWIVTFSNTSELTPTGFRRTETLWHPGPFPDTQQPTWDFLASEEYSLRLARP